MFACQFRLSLAIDWSLTLILARGLLVAFEDHSRSEPSIECVWAVAADCGSDRTA
ncbi:hypothetical protein RE6C_01891 [Rhodopirellula europaea 6C]|uniref:Uncharacterized protein n=1 Tax=Rhodopirellula europaea 6C TaxID=1263867 RepID=M2B6H8_9BACT|nr:hypothetical protein RE6C_01891 [Rhodopirellula europaea 6C]